MFKLFLPLIFTGGADFYADQRLCLGRRVAGDLTRILFLSALISSNIPQGKGSKDDEGRGYF
jgi:hypothetical protein